LFSSDDLFRVKYPQSTADLFNGASSITFTPIVGRDYRMDGRYWKFTPR
jgi:hypothetical protein